MLAGAAAALRGRWIYYFAIQALLIPPVFLALSPGILSASGLLPGVIACARALSSKQFRLLALIVGSGFAADMCRQFLYDVTQLSKVGDSYTVSYASEKSAVGETRQVAAQLDKAAADTSGDTPPVENAVQQRNKKSASRKARHEDFKKALTAIEHSPAAVAYVQAQIAYIEDDPAAAIQAYQSLTLEPFSYGPRTRERLKAIERYAKAHKDNRFDRQAYEARVNIASFASAFLLYLSIVLYGMERQIGRRLRKIAKLKKKIANMGFAAQ